MKAILSLLVLLSAGVASANFTSVFYNQNTLTPYCDAWVNTKCTDGDKCWVNVSSSKCRDVRLYDVIDYANNRMEPGPQSIDVKLSGSYPAYYTQQGGLYVLKSQFRYAGFFAASVYYVPMFLSNDAQAIYDKVLLRFNSK